jgi:hypothetical protein
MFTHPDRIGQLAAEHHQHMLAQARHRTLRHQHGRRSSRTPDAAVRITRRLTAAITRAGIVAAETPGVTWPARPHQLSGSATEAQPSGHGH